MSIHGEHEEMEYLLSKVIVDIMMNGNDAIAHHILVCVSDAGCLEVRD